MSERRSRQDQVVAALSGATLPPGIIIRPWMAHDFLAIQRLSSAEGWPTVWLRPTEAMAAWGRSWPALVATDGESVVGFLRALTDGEVTTYVAELLVERSWRRKGIGLALVDTCQALCPHTRIDVLSADSAAEFYEAGGFRPSAGFRRSRG